MQTCACTLSFSKYSCCCNHLSIKSDSICEQTRTSMCAHCKIKYFGTPWELLTWQIRCFLYQMQQELHSKPQLRTVWERCRPWWQHVGQRSRILIAVRLTTAVNLLSALPSLCCLTVQVLKYARKPALVVVMECSIQLFGRKWRTVDKIL